jgi:hypothetical protein
VRLIHGESDGPGCTAWFWRAFPARPDGQPPIPAGIQLTWPDSPGADGCVPLPPPGSPATPSPGVPEGFTDRGNNWSSSGVKLRSTRR